MILKSGAGRRMKIKAELKKSCYLSKLLNVVIQVKK